MARKLPGLIEEAALLGLNPPGRRDAERAARAANAGREPLRPYLERLDDLKAMRRPMEPVWREVRRYLLPESGRLLDSDPGADDDNHCLDYSGIVDSSPAKAATTAASGLHGGLTSPSVQWFSFYVGDYQEFSKGDNSAVKNWVYNAQICVRDILASANFYSAIQKFYLEELGFLTACMMITHDPLTVARFQALDVGSYWLGHGDDRRIDVMYRKYASTARDILARHGRENTPRRVIEAVEGGKPARRFYVIQAVQPWNWFGNAGNHPDFKYEDVRFVEGSGDDDPVLYRGGYGARPFVATRWGDSGDLVYGRSGPGVASLPDNKQLQVMTRHANMASEWQVDPAWLVPSDMKEKLGEGIAPGMLIPYSGDPKGAAVLPVIPSGAFDFAYTLQKCQDLRQLVQDAFFNRYFVLIQSRERQMTATEVMQLVQEKSDLLGPVVMQNMSEGLTPMLERVYGLAVANGLLPPAPPEIAGEEVKPYFTSSLAIAQRQAAMSGMNVFAAWFVQQLQMGNAEVKDVVNLDAWLRELAETEQIPASILRGEDEVEEIRAGRAQQMRQRAQMEQVRQGAAVARDLGATPAGGDNLLGRMMGEGGGGAELPGGMGA